MGIARDSFADGRLSAVSITDNPGGNPSLSPDVLGHDIFTVGMDVIVHFTCRDMNRVGMESRALQLAMMGMKNLLALTGDYTGKGFGGQGAPVFDLDAVNLLMMLDQLSHRLYEPEIRMAFLRDVPYPLSSTPRRNALRNMPNSAAKFQPVPASS